MSEIQEGIAWSICVKCGKKFVEKDEYDYTELGKHQRASGH